MVNVGDASFERHGEVRAGPRVPRGTHIVCAASHIMPLDRKRRGSPAAAPLAAIAAHVVHTPAPTRQRPPTDRSPTLLRRPTLQPFEETVATTLVQKTRTVIDRTPSRRRSRRSSARCSTVCTSRRRRREADEAGTRGRSISRGAAFTLASQCSSSPRCSTRRSLRRRRTPRPAPRRRAACRRSMASPTARSTLPSASCAKDFYQKAHAYPRRSSSTVARASCVVRRE